MLQLAKEDPHIGRDPQSAGSDVNRAWVHVLAQIQNDAAAARRSEAAASDSDPQEPISLGAEETELGPTFQRNRLQDVGWYVLPVDRIPSSITVWRDMGGSPTFYRLKVRVADTFRETTQIKIPKTVEVSEDIPIESERQHEGYDADPTRGFSVHSRQDHPYYGIREENENGEIICWYFSAEACSIRPKSLACCADCQQ